MDERVLRLKTPEECEIFARNALERDRPDLDEQARKWSISLKAESHPGQSEVEKECRKAIHAYEATLTRKNGRTTRATRTWQMIERHGLLQAVERAVNRPAETAGYRALVEMGLKEFAFEAVILRHPVHFSEEAIRRARDRLSDWADAES